MVKFSFSKSITFVFTVFSKNVTLRSYSIVSIFTSPCRSRFKSSLYLVVIKKIDFFVTEFDSPCITWALKLKRDLSDTLVGGETQNFARNARRWIVCINIALCREIKPRWFTRCCRTLSEMCRRRRQSSRANDARDRSLLAITRHVRHSPSHAGHVSPTKSGECIFRNAHPTIYIPTIWARSNLVDCVHTWFLCARCMITALDTWSQLAYNTKKLAETGRSRNYIRVFATSSYPNIYFKVAQ